mmetsp:Transcript_13466/g.32820  ORF Transcript_13466/g.32820 Transcript_13466/m.32820 type:complete len:84 (-) Transcript_13466:1245-1496(-)
MKTSAALHPVKMRSNDAWSSTAFMANLVQNEIPTIQVLFKQQGLASAPCLLFIPSYMESKYFGMKQSAQKYCLDLRFRGSNHK